MRRADWRDLYHENQRTVSITLVLESGVPLGTGSYGLVHGTNHNIESMVHQSQVEPSPRGEKTECRRFWSRHMDMGSCLLCSICRWWEQHGLSSTEIVATTHSSVGIQCHDAQGRKQAHGCLSCDENGLLQIPENKDCVEDNPSRLVTSESFEPAPAEVFCPILLLHLHSHNVTRREQDRAGQFLLFPGLWMHDSH